MFEIVKDTNIKFSKYFTITGIFSVITMIVCLYFILTQMKYGVDFRGGAEVQVKFGNAINVNTLRGNLDQAGFGGGSVQSIGDESANEYLIRVQGDEGNLNQITEKVQQMLNTEYQSAGMEIRKVDIVGPKAGAELRKSGFLAMLWAILAIMIYIGLRFDFKYAPGAIVALFHDVIIVLGIFALTGTEFTLQTVAAVLAVIGYSVNDTVIVYDRVREHEQKYAGRTLTQNIDNAINETMSRTILTSGTTLFVSITMLLMGGLAIKDFFLAMTLGIIVGTYSSVFIAGQLTIFFGKYAPKKKVETGEAQSV